MSSFPLSFHQTFAPEKEAIAQLVQFASIQNNKFFTKEEISEQTSIPTGKSSGKVIPHINYADAMGLINVEKDGGKYRLSLTPLGLTVSKEDPYLIEELTSLLCHYNLSSLSSKAKLWSYIYNTVIKSLGREITNATLKTSLEKFFNTKEINITPFRTCYLEGKCFGDLYLLTVEGDKYKFRPHRIERSYKYLYGYLLLRDWEKLIPNQSEITYDMLVNDLGYGNPFIWDEFNVNESLEMLHEERVITINRQLSPITLIRQKSSNSILSLLYSLLI